ncbi:hypothetical protein ACLHK8_05410 [Pediococcus sp. M21F004]|uniref:hypothetical protein n=1 Tax=Pediococcus sp. M21F004 TaxID=3390033 RepID=UPI003DA736C9
MLESEKITDPDQLQRVNTRLDQTEHPRVGHIKHNASNTRDYLLEIGKYENDEMTLPQLRDILVGSGSDSYTDNVVAQIGPDRFQFYVFEAMFEAEPHYHEQHYEKYNFEF